MKLEELAERTGFSVDQARRRANNLASLKVIQRVKLRKEQGRWDYGDDASEAMQQLAHYERDLGMTAKAGTQRLLEERLGNADQTRSIAEIEVELIELRQRLGQRDREIRILNERIQDLRARRLPVEREAWHRRLVWWVRSFLRPKDNPGE